MELTKFVHLICINAWIGTQSILTGIAHGPFWSPQRKAVFQPPNQDRTSDNPMSVMLDTKPTAPPDARFWDRIARRYARTPVPDEAIYQKKLSLTRKWMTPQMHVLEFGCGTGSTALKHAPFVNRILALDISAKMLDIARGKAAPRHSQCVFRAERFCLIPSWSRTI